MSWYDPIVTTGKYAGLALSFGTGQLLAAELARKFYRSRDALWETIKNYPAHLRTLAQQREFRVGLGAMGLGAGVMTGNPTLATSGGAMAYQGITGDSPPPELAPLIQRFATDEIDWSAVGTDAGKLALTEAAKHYPEVIGAIGEIIDEAAAQIQKAKAVAAASYIAAKKAQEQAKRAVEIAQKYRDLYEREKGWELF